MIHLYFGDGKGKTTAAMGLVLRTVGRGGGAVVAQFLKGADTGERRTLALLPGVKLLPVPEQVKFTFAMTPEERKAEEERTLALLKAAVRACGEEGCALAVLDEVCDAVDTGLLPLETLLSALDRMPCEVVLTGHRPCQALLDRADYLTQFQKLRHPFDRGAAARRGIEY